MDTSPTTPLREHDRQRLRTAVWLLIVAAALALLGIFGFGMFTGAGGYFDEATTEGALRDYYWQIWGILLPIAIATVISGVALFLMAGVLKRMRTGWTATVNTVTQWVIVPAAAAASAPYWMGPQGEDSASPAWLEPVSGLAGMLSFVAVLAMGLTIFALPMPKWTGAALGLGALAAYAAFLPLFIFVGTLAGGIGILRWNRKALEAQTRAPTETASGH